MLSVSSQITVHYKVRVYVIIHKSESYLTASANSLSAIAYPTLALIFAAAFVVLALFTYVVYIPIRKITHAADEYSKGNFDAKIDVHSNDEIGIKISLRRVPMNMPLEISRQRSMTIPTMRSVILPPRSTIWQTN